MCSTGLPLILNLYFHLTAAESDIHRHSHSTQSRAHQMERLQEREREKEKSVTVLAVCFCSVFSQLRHSTKSTLSNLMICDQSSWSQILFTYRMIWSSVHREVWSCCSLKISRCFSLCFSLSISSPLQSRLPVLETTLRPSPTSVPTAPSRLPTPATCPSTSASTPGPSPTPAPTARKHSGSSVTYSSTHGTGLGWAVFEWLDVFLCVHVWELVSGELWHCDCLHLLHFCAIQFW